MPVTPTYPGVYIEEIASGVHSITGVATSIAAFVDSFTRGPLNEAVRIFSIADFEREFGGLNTLSEASYAINQFFLNGGSEAHVVRVAGGTPAASAVVVVDDSGAEVFRVRAGQQIRGEIALNPGTWGDALRVEVDYNTAATEFFNLTVSEVSTAGGSLQVLRSETFRNLTMRPGAPTNALEVVNAGSALVQLDRDGMADVPDPAFRPAATGTLGAELPVGPTSPFPSGSNSLTFSVDPGTGAVDVTLTYEGADDPPDFPTLRPALEAAVRAAGAASTPPNPLLTGASVRLIGRNTAESPYRFVVQAGRGGPSFDPDTLLTFSRDAWSVGADLPTAGTLPIPATGATFNVDPGTGDVLCTIDYGTDPAPTDYPALRPYLESAIRAADAANPLLAEAEVHLLGEGTTNSPYRFLIQPGPPDPSFDPSIGLTFSEDAGTTAADLGLLTTEATYLGLSATPNVQQYSLTGGAAGTVPDAAALRGTRSAKSGIYALEDVDLFNILCLPASAQLSATNMAAVIAEAEIYCEEKRAFLLVDIPERIKTLPAMLTWMSQNDNLRHRNAAVYFPRPMIPDPLNENRLRSVGPSGTVAGLFARTDADRGVWKAPAGVDAALRNVQDLAYVLTDPENGALNPLGVNCLRRFPIYGQVSWGARTLVGSDQQASEWKYVPVRRFALFLEESLYRGTKWVVFEPNDEPLWSQIRLNLGAFMHNLFRQGAFQGKTPREAYLVKCDRETTTQADIDLGVVNILVAFAPLKPAEFVIIRIQQLAGQLEV